MRKALREIGSEQRHVFRGTFARKGMKNGWNGPEETILLQDVKDKNGKILTDHLWFNNTLGFQDACLKEGDEVEFQARVSVYEKGYKGQGILAMLLDEET